MDWFSIWLNFCTLTTQGCLMAVFAVRFTKKKLTVWCLILNLLLFYVCDYAASLYYSAYLGIGAALFVLYGINRFLLGNSRSMSCVTTFIAFYVIQFSFGVINAFESILFPSLIGHRLLLYLLLVLATLLAFTICICCYWCIVKWFPLQEDRWPSYIWMLLPPGLFFLTVELYILHTAYSTITIVPYSAETGKQFILLILQLLGLGALFSTLYAYKRTCNGFGMQLALASLTQETHAQKVYVAQAQMRYEQTQAFRHDIKNHLAVLDGLLKNGQYVQARSYLQKLETVTAALSLPFYTGNPVVDVLLADKLQLAAANGIKYEVSLTLPKQCSVDDLDLCIIFANALDNAIQACLQISGPRFISIAGERQCDFYMLEFENTCSFGTLPSMGTGLSNIKAVADNYNGAMTIEKSSCYVRLNVLLNISLQQKGNSRQFDCNPLESI